MAETYFHETVETVTILHNLNIQPQLKSKSAFEYVIQLEGYKYLNFKCIFQHANCVEGDGLETRSRFFLHVQNQYEGVDIDSFSESYRKLAPSLHPKS